MPGCISMIEVDHHSSGVFSFLFSAILSAYRSVYSKLCDGVPVVSKLLKNLLSVGAERWRRRDRLWVAAGEAESRAHHGNFAINSRRRLEVFDKPSLGDLWMFQDFRDRQNLAGGNTVFVEEIRPLLC